MRLSSPWSAFTDIYTLFLSLQHSYHGMFIMVTLAWFSQLCRWCLSQWNNRRPWRSWKWYSIIKRELQSSLKQLPAALNYCSHQMELVKPFSHVMNYCTGKAWRSSGNSIRTTSLGNGNMGAKRSLTLLQAFYVEMYVMTSYWNIARKNKRRDDEGDN